MREIIMLIFRIVIACSFATYSFVKINELNQKIDKIKIVKTFILIVLLNSPIIILVDEYNSIKIMMMTLSIVVICKLLFNNSLIFSIVYSLYISIVFWVADTVASMITYLFIKTDIFSIQYNLVGHAIIFAIIFIIIKKTKYYISDFENTYWTKSNKLIIAISICFIGPVFIFSFFVSIWKTIDKYMIIEPKVAIEWYFFRLGVIAIISISSVVALIMIKEYFKQKEKFQKDSLTNAYNRTTGQLIINEMIKKSEIRKQFLVVCFLDLDDLKKVNDRLGHNYGDKYISKIAEVLMNSIDKKDVLIRFGGDEFIIIFINKDINQSRAILIKVEDKLSEINSTNITDYKYSISYGFSEKTIDNRLSADEMIEIADSNMYVHKNNKKSINLA